MNYLISTEPNDSHAILVKLALEKMGHQVKLLFTADRPTKQKNTIYIDNLSSEWKSADNYQAITETDYDVVWFRKARSAYVPKTLVHPDDYSFIMQENILFSESIAHSMAPDAWWVNDRNAANRADSLVLQLKTASAEGISIPSTLCSNDPKEIRYFLLKHEDEGVFYKPLGSHLWFEEKYIKQCRATKISFLELPNNKMLQLTPGLFQKEIKKKYELRVTCFGEYLVATKIYDASIKKEPGSLKSNNNIILEPYNLPEELAQKIKSFMNTMGLVFGTIDFIVTSDDDYVFLKVDEQGDFLWIEERNPGFRMLDIFVNFLVNRSPNYRWNPRHMEHSIIDNQDELVPCITQNIRRHIGLGAAP